VRLTIVHTLCYVYDVPMYINGVVADGSAADRVPGQPCEMSCLPSRTVLYGVLYKQEVVLTTFFGKWGHEQHWMHRLPGSRTSGNGPALIAGPIRRAGRSSTAGSPRLCLPVNLSTCQPANLPTSSSKSGHDHHEFINHLRPDRIRGVFKTGLRRPCEPCWMQRPGLNGPWKPGAAAPWLFTVPG
jgi:hypothetical protein